MTDSSVITQTFRPLKLVMAPKIQVRRRHVPLRYPTIFLRKISNAFSNEYLGRACVAGTLKRISYEIHFGLVRKYVDSHTNVATESWCQGTSSNSVPHATVACRNTRSTRETHAKHIQSHHSFLA